MTITITHHAYAVNVYRGEEFLGGLTRHRMEKGTEDVAIVLAALLKELGIAAAVKEE